NPEQAMPRAEEFIPIYDAESHRPEDWEERGRDFFFSSRRRHTRSKRDWSSDVCSSDLLSPVMAITGRTTTAMKYPSTIMGPRKRSEERRVGKECRSRGLAYH